MNGQVLRTAWYRFLVTFRRRGGGYLVVLLLLGLVGGVALASIAGARRTQASQSTYLSDTNPSDLAVFTAFDNPALGFSTGYDPATMRLDYRLLPASVRNAQGNTVTGPNVFLIRTRGDPQAALRSLQRISREINAAPASSGASGGVVSALRPAEISDSRTMEAVPAALSVTLAAGALAALGITLATSVRRRRRDLAILKSLGLPGRQVAAVIAWQATVAVAIGALAGVPFGIALGRLLWNLFATELHAVPAPEVPVLSVVLIACGAVILANIVAAVPGRIAARTPTALLLRVE